MYVVDSLADSVQRSRGADCEIGHRHIIVYRSDESHNPKVPVARNLFIRDAIWPGLTERSQISQGRRGVELTNLAIEASECVSATRT